MSPGVAVTPAHLFQPSALGYGQAEAEMREKGESLRQPGDGNGPVYGPRSHGNASGSVLCECWLWFSVMCESVVTCLGKIHDRWISEQ